jgi:hypothetical protein
MNLKFILIFILTKFEISLNQNSESFSDYETLVQNSTNKLKMSLNFEAEYFLNSFENKKELLSKIKCLSMHSKNVFTMSVSYENLDNSRIICKAYSKHPELVNDTSSSLSYESRVYVMNKKSQSKPPLPFSFNFQVPQNQ